MYRLKDWGVRFQPPEVAFGKTPTIALTKKRPEKQSAPEGKRKIIVTKAARTARWD